MTSRVCERYSGSRRLSVVHHDDSSRHDASWHDASHGTNSTQRAGRTLAFCPDFASLSDRLSESVAVCRETYFASSERVKHSPHFCASCCTICPSSGDGILMHVPTCGHMMHSTGLARASCFYDHPFSSKTPTGRCCRLQEL